MRQPCKTDIFFFKIVWILRTTLICVNNGTSKTIDFNLGQTENSSLLGAPILKHFRIYYTERNNLSNCLILSQFVFKTYILKIN